MIHPVLKSAAAGNRENQDRGAVIVGQSACVLIVADGAGGLSGGLEAAVLAIEIAERNCDCFGDSSACANFLQDLDRQICEDKIAGETTCAIAVATDDQIFGASVGDSGVWIIAGNEVLDLTRRQVRKPLIGSGSANPMGFLRHRIQGRLLLASDGLLKYASRERIATTIWETNNEKCASALIEIVRLPSGELPDDVTVIVATL